MLTSSVRDVPTPCRTLVEYLTALIRRLGQEEPHLLTRLRTVVGARRARIGLDDEIVEVWFDGPELKVVPGPTDVPVDGEGSTDRFTTLDILDGRLEVTDAVLEGRLRATGEVESLARIFQAIDILLDGSARNPALQELSLDYGGDPCRRGRPPRPSGTGPRRVMIDPARVAAAERDMLHRLELLP
jgi:hypothetical protein